MAALLRAWALALPANTRGCLWAFGSMAAFGCVDAAIKSMGSTMHPLQLAFFRCLFGFAFTAPIVLAMGGFARVATRRIGAHFFRTMLGYSAMTCGFVSIANMPIADAVALGYVRPLFLVVLAVLLLGETVRWRRWTATAVGFLGVVVMVRPGAGAFDPYALVALLGGFLVACVTVALKRLSETERAETTVFWFGAFSTLLSFGPALMVWRWPDGWQWFAVAGLGVLGALGQYTIMRAYRIAEATAVDPVDYGRMVMAAVFGLFVFGELPDIYTVAGALIITASTLYIARRGAVLGVTPIPPAG
ncbi:MAG: DMT family transporter [Proteobacteria bacterium]|nr:DMT family transporter [Pseudomonadota bacterium]